MLDLQNVYKNYQVKKQSFLAIDDVSFHVDKGEIYGIIGLSGAGKTTIIKLICGLEEPTSGKIFIDHEERKYLSRKELQEFQKKIGIVFQGYNLLNQKNVFENITMPLKLEKNYSKEMIAAKGLEMLKLVGLESKRHHYPKQLSGGQKQRVAIARSLITHPKILLLDEPTSALDPITTKRILGLIQKIQRETSLTILMITHDNDLVKAVCNRVLILNNGKKVFEDWTQNFSSEEEKIAELLLGEVNETCSIY